MDDELRVPVDLDERVIAHVAPIPLGEKDVEVEGLAEAVRLARTTALQLLELRKTSRADRSMTQEAAALRVRAAALKQAERVAARMDAARASAAGAVEQAMISTGTPGAPRDNVALALETEIRASLKAMSDVDRQKAIAAAFEAKDEAVIGAVLRGPSFLTGMGPAQLDAARHRYRQTFHGETAKIAERRQKAVEAADRAGKLFVGLIRRLTESRSISHAARQQQAREQAETALGDGA